MVVVVVVLVMIVVVVLVVFIMVLFVVVVVVVGVGGGWWWWAKFLGSVAGLLLMGSKTYVHSCCAAGEWCWVKRGVWWLW